MQVGNVNCLYEVATYGSRDGGGGGIARTRPPPAQCRGSAVWISLMRRLLPLRALPGQGLKWGLHWGGAVIEARISRMYRQGRLETLAPSARGGARPSWGSALPGAGAGAILLAGRG
ncbi:MAG: hypothetical protein OXU61_04310 [Gammaproteobacteria bacterium]|nr:hypothetical protein [Gammaproteobacteria bacterium]